MNKITDPDTLLKIGFFYVLYVWNNSYIYIVSKNEQKYS